MADVTFNGLEGTPIVNGGPNGTGSTAPTSTNQQQILIYPPDIDSSGGMALTLIEYEYKRPTIDDKFKPEPTQTSITLPLPANLSSTYVADWGDVTQTAFEHQLVKGGNHIVDNKDKIDDWIKSSKTKSYESILNSVTDFGANHGLGIASDVGIAIASDFLTATPIIGQITASQGKARNPWLAAVFQGVGFRSFNFSYNFFPKSADESETLDRIFRALKYGMHPSYDENFANNLFKYPNMYAPIITPQSAMLFDFGYCVIKSVDIAYHGQGTPVYFNNSGKKAPASMMLTFTLQEIEIVTKESVDPARKGGPIAQGLMSRDSAKVTGRGR